jgi:hypothetical protein
MGKLWNVITSKNNAKKGKALEGYNFQKTMQRKGRFWNVVATQKNEEKGRRNSSLMMVGGALNSKHIVE